jgi:hypothetical protein
VNVSAAAGNQAEATVAVDPTNPQRIFVASNPGTTAAISTNGGVTWTTFGLGVPGDGLPAPCCDNVAAWDQFGNLFLVYIGLGADGNVGTADDTIELLISTTGGGQGSFTVLQQIDVGNVDQPTVAVGAGSVWVTWNNGGTIYARGAAVSGLGQVGAFTARQAAPGSATVGGQFGDIAIGPAGQVMVTYQTNTQIFVNTDADGLGAGGFGAQVTVTNTNVAKFDSIPPQSARTVDAEAGLVYDRSGGPNDGRVYLVYTDEPIDENNDTDIFLRFSDDDGATWSAAVRVNDDNTTNSQFLPHVALDQTTPLGFLAITWHDCRNDSGVGAGDTNVIANDDAQLWGTFSTNGGLSFLPNVQISAGTSNAVAAASNVDYGDYRSSDFVGGSLFAVWADNSNSTGDNPNGTLSRFDIYTAQVTLNVTAGPVDIFMIVDQSGSFADDLAVFKAQATGIISTIKSSNSDVRFGLAKFEDYPIAPFGQTDPARGDTAYQRLVDLTSDSDAVVNAIAGLPTPLPGDGGDNPQSQLAALFQAATGAGQDLSGAGFAGASIPAGQQATFRDGAFKLMLLWTDDTFHMPGDAGDIPYPGPSFAQTVAAINALDPPLVVGISSGPNGVPDLQGIAMATNALAPEGGADCDGDGIPDIPEGEPLVCQIASSGEGLGKAIVTVVDAAIKAATPVAKCMDVSITTDPGVCTAAVTVDDGSFDPDGGPVSLEQTPPGPYPVGNSSVTLKVVDETGLTAYCVASVRVTYAQPPTLPTIDCRLETLRERVLALAKDRPLLEPLLAKAITRKEEGQAMLAAGDVRRAKNRLQSALERLVHFERNVRSLTGRKRLTAEESGPGPEPRSAPVTSGSPAALLLAQSGPLIKDLQTIIDGL